MKRRKWGLDLAGWLGGVAGRGRGEGKTEQGTYRSFDYNYKQLKFTSIPQKGSDYLLQFKSTSSTGSSVIQLRGLCIS